MNVLLALSVAASAFNLNCTGTQTIDSWEGLKRSPISREAVSIVFRVDLDKGFYCSGDCAATAPIMQVDDSRIVFDRREDEIGDEYTMVNRRTGAYSDRLRVFLPPTGMLVTMTTGSCEPTDFSGFPAKKF